MLPQSAARRFGAYQYAVMAAVTGLGFVGAPWWMVLIAAVLLFGSVLFDYAEGHATLAGANATAAAGGSVLAVAAMSIGFAVICYLGGHTLAGVILG